MEGKSNEITALPALLRLPDVTMNEDQSWIRKDHAPENLATLRHLALNLIKQANLPKASVRRRLKKAGLDNSCLEAIPVSYRSPWVPIDENAQSDIIS